MMVRLKGTHMFGIGVGPNLSTYQRASHLALALRKMFSTDMVSA